jgi:hypothetical protein
MQSLSAGEQSRAAINGILYLRFNLVALRPAMQRPNDRSFREAVSYAQLLDAGDQPLGEIIGYRVE